MTIKFYKQAESFAKHMRRHDLDCEIDSSNLSSSAYAIVSKIDSIDHYSLKIRFSDHKTPASYSRADLDVGPHDHGVASVLDAVEHVLKYFDLVPTGATKAALARSATRQHKIAQQKAESMQRYLAENKPRMDAEARLRKYIDKALEETGKSALTGKARKRARSKFKKKFISECICGNPEFAWVNAIAAPQP